MIFWKTISAPAGGDVETARHSRRSIDYLPGPFNRPWQVPHPACAELI